MDLLKEATRIGELERTLTDQDHVTDVVPLSERRGPITMGLLWLTMVTAFPNVFIGFECFKSGITLVQFLQGIAVSMVIVLAYTIPSTYLGAKSGQTYCVLSRRVFGAWGSRLVSFNLVWIFMLFYALMAGFLADEINAVCHFAVPTPWLAAGIAVLMAFNNFFGFKGIANFARYLAAPVLIVWVGYTFIKATASCPSAVFTSTPHVSLPYALTMVSGLAIGLCVWGNEADYWRFGRPEKKLSVLPLLAALFFGQAIFPITGWMMAYMTGVTEYGAATNLMNQYAFGGIAFLITAVLVVSYFALNDSNLYGAVNALENLKEMPHRYVVAAFALISAVAAACMVGQSKILDTAATINGIVLPGPTVIMLIEYFWFKPRYEPDTKLEHIVPFSGLPSVQWSAIIAFLSGTAFGVATSGMIPGTEKLHIGVCALQSWLVMAIVYYILRRLEYYRAAEQKVQLETLLQEARSSTAQLVEID